MQPITFQTYKFIPNVSTTKLSLSYLDKDLALAESVSSKIRNAFPNVLSNLILADEEISAFIDIVGQIQSDIKMDHFDDARKDPQN